MGSNPTATAIFSLESVLTRPRRLNLPGEPADVGLLAGDPVTGCRSEGGLGGRAGPPHTRARRWGPWPAGPCPDNSEDPPFRAACASPDHAPRPVRGRNGAGRRLLGGAAHLGAADRGGQPCLVDAGPRVRGGRGHNPSAPPAGPGLARRPAAGHRAVLLLGARSVRGGGSPDWSFSWRSDRSSCATGVATPR